MSAIFDQHPALLLNADYRPMNIFPLSLLSAQEALKLIYEDVIVRVADYDVEVRSPSTTVKLPSVVALKNYIKRPRPEYPPFNRFNLFLRDKFKCQYCGGKFKTGELTFEHVIPQCDGGKTTWENVVAACGRCNTLKGNRYDMKPKRLARQPTWKELDLNKKLFPPNYLHETWLDYLYWDSPLESN